LANHKFCRGRCNGWVMIRASGEQDYVDIWPVLHCGRGELEREQCEPASGCPVKSWYPLSFACLATSGKSERPRHLTMNTAVFEDPRFRRMMTGFTFLVNALAYPPPATFLVSDPFVSFILSTSQCYVQLPPPSPRFFEFISLLLSLFSI